MSVSQLLPLIILLPLLGAFINGTIGKSLSKVLVGTIATGVMLVSFILATMAFMGVQHGEPVTAHLFTMIKTESFSLHARLYADNLSMWMTMIVTGVGTLIHLFSMGYMKHDAGYYKFFTYLNLFIFAMLVLVLGSNYFMLFFGWEGVGICSYLLIGFWYQDFKNTLAARKAFIMNRIGDLGLLIGLFLILGKFGTLEYAEVAKAVLAEGFEISECLIFGITICLFIGATGKSAQIPLFTWLPDAMAGPTPVSALIHAATMVTAGIFLTVRSSYLFEHAHLTKEIMLYIGLATSIVAAFIAMRQNDIKKVLAYSTVSQLGMLFVALGMGAYTAAMFHVTTHAFFKALLFLGSGSVIHAMSDEQDIRKMGGLRKKIPITHFTFLIGTLAISGIPLLSGFYSKDEIIGHAFESHKFVYFALMFSSALTAIYMFRLYFVTFFGTFRGTHEQEHHVHEGPASMTLPLIILAILSIFGGLLNLPGVFLHKGTHWLSHHYAQNVDGLKTMGEHADPNTTLMLMVAAGAMAVIIAIVTYIVYVKKNSVPVADEQLKGWEKASAMKLYFDEIYDFLFVKPTLWLSEKGAHYFEGAFLHRSVVGLGKTIGKSGDLIRKIQTGRTDNYILWMVFGIIGLIVYYIIYYKN
ncbi:NADH-quinone oxidoreductase subunit L [Fluviicola sp.]|uniref:NADH-quinone oxidoreductase subunit L n=1 Tax=Fluviicola sp. TaxID=1917219 RepID=UPI00262A94C4|nr:NADH-quinone oxidoreductase subunit L [Fluviicola sp.]